MSDATQGMVGGGYYDAHSTFQADVAESASRLLERACAALSLPPGGTAMIADYGCAEGRNSMATISTALTLLAARGLTSLAVLHNDLPTNDWRGLADSLLSSSSYLRRFPQSRGLFAPCSFFERVTLPGSITLGVSGSAAHWLSRQPPDLDMPTSLYRSDAPASELPKILAQAASDWEAFLAARAEELQPGGVLLVLMLGSDASVDPIRISAASLLSLMNDCALQLIQAGDIPSDIYARYCFPVVPRTIAEASAPVEGALADRLELLHCGLTAVPSPYQQALESSGDIDRFARDYTAFTRAFSQSSLRQSLFRHGSGDPDVLADRFYTLLQERIRADPQACPFDDLTLAMLLRRRA
jgi:gibberellin A4 carboxyl methyltransferase